MKVSQAVEIFNRILKKDPVVVTSLFRISATCGTSLCEDETLNVEILEDRSDQKDAAGNSLSKIGRVSPLDFINVLCEDAVGIILDEKGLIEQFVELK